MKLSSAHKKKHDVDNTLPLINVVFLMLIFFLIAGTVAAPIAEDLAPAETAKTAVIPPAANVIQIQKSGKMELNGQPYRVNELLDRFPAKDQQRSEPLRFLADKSLKAVELVKILEKFRAAGHKNIRLITIKGAGA